MLMQLRDVWAQATLSSASYSESVPDWYPCTVDPNSTRFASVVLTLVDGFLVIFTDQRVGVEIRRDKGLWYIMTDGVKMRHQLPPVVYRAKEGEWYATGVTS